LQPSAAAGILAPVVFKEVSVQWRKAAIAYIVGATVLMLIGGSLQHFGL
jgi:hypothetical protein